jgi:LysR family transcriptional activator of glutamate synthase operon
VALLAKSGRNVRLTEAGEALLVHAQSILAEVAAAEAHMYARLGMQAGRVRIGAPPTVGLWLLPDVLADFHRRHPAIELQIHQGSTSQLTQQLALGELDMAFVTLPIAERGHHIIELFDEPLLAVMHAEHPLKQYDSIHIAQLANEALLLYPAIYEMHEVILSVFRGEGISPKVVLDGGDVALLLRLAQAGLGIAIVPQLALRDDQHSHRVAIQHPRMRRKVGLITRSDRALTVPAQVLHDTLRTALQRVTASM